MSTRITKAEMTAALRESVRLQSHYAELLNAWDGGNRLSFPNAEVWVEWLRVKKQKKEAMT